jgi:trans-aconitate methyltransferase
MWKRILTIRGVHYIATRFCGATIQQWAFDEMYKSGKWHFNATNNELTSVVEKHAANGNILMVGCGRATILDCLKQDNFNHFCGIDISAEAISRASKYSSDKIQFHVADILDYQCQKNFDVILFSESLYYIQASRREALLNRLCLNLNANGRIIVTLSDPERYKNIIRMITQNFRCSKGRNFSGSKRYILVFSK